MPMKQTAYGTPLLLRGKDITVLKQVDAFSEASLQELIFNHPSFLPISDIDESFNPMLPGKVVSVQCKKGNQQ